MNKNIIPEHQTRQIDKSILDSAKAFLCWELFPNLTIQLVQMQETVSYFHPPFNRSTIIIFYKNENPDYSIPLFLLFHEVGHYIQYEKMQQKGMESLFWQNINAPTGSSRTAFEKESWEEGKIYFNRFIEKIGLHHSLLNEYDTYAKMSVETYQDFVK